MVVAAVIKQHYVCELRVSPSPEPQLTSDLPAAVMERDFLLGRGRDRKLQSELNLELGARQEQLLVTIQQQQQQVSLRRKQRHGRISAQVATSRNDKDILCSWTIESFSVVLFVLTAFGHQCLYFLLVIKLFCFIY